MSTATKTLKGVLRAPDAADLRSDLLAAVGEGDLFIDTASLTELDCSILQVLLAACQTAKQHERALYITAPIGGAVTSLLTRLGLPSDALRIA